MRQLKLLHKGETKESNSLASRILQQADILKTKHKNELQVGDSPPPPPTSYEALLLLSSK